MVLPPQCASTVYRACTSLLTHIGLTGAGPIAGVVIAGVVLLVILLLLVLFGLLVYTRKKSPERTCKIFEIYIFHICMAKVHGDEVTGLECNYTSVI